MSMCQSGLAHGHFNSLDEQLRRTIREVVDSTLLASGRALRRETTHRTMQISRRETERERGRDRVRDREGEGERVRGRARVRERQRI